MANYSTDVGGSSKSGAEAAHGVVDHNLEAVESGVDTAIDGAKGIVHEFRGKVQDLADELLDRVNQSWEEQRPRVEAYMNAHPWVVFGGLILLAYLVSGNQRPKETMRYPGR
jgi:CHASE3 domain sensor protein